MNPITHVLSGWALVELFAPSLTWREKAVITSAALVPDVDGLGLAVELATRDSARPLLWWTEYHHVLGHNLAFAVAVAFFAFLISSRPSRKTVAALAFVAVHLHIAGDVAGSRGPDDYQWPIPYLYPFTSALQLAWSGQWYLNAWPNVLITTVLLALTARMAWQRGLLDDRDRLRARGQSFCSRAQVTLRRSMTRPMGCSWRRRFIDGAIERCGHIRAQEA